ncbi:hypothetical protein PV328_000846 [Microctonus aethiopoides]|uniref:Ig-like domain-containing protein n=1 Tax=Microctonus aethiopoides TaxID=144406 RepID=A0AA39KWV5_9HYME|nr:hypothetical protein PV328_000846 [Microctonus aethiopoides]
MKPKGSVNCDYELRCAFPPQWEGSWFQSGVRQPIVISKNILSSKGRCLRNEGDKFLVVDEKSCYRCVVIHEKHVNVLQYKETYCHNRNSLASLCSFITGDALLYSMFREEAMAVPCPFRGPMTFTYNRGHGTCSSPLSNVDTCTDDSRLLFKYQACPDVPASESAVEELECLALWKEGSSRYLVGRLHHGHASSNEERYRCFVYERVGQSVGGLNRGTLGMATVDHEMTLPAGGPNPESTPEVYRVAQSGDATCNGLFSPMEGSRTMTLTKASSPGKCRFPDWLTGYSSGGLTWHTLDLTRSYTFHSRNASLHVTRSNTSNSWFNGGGDGGAGDDGVSNNQDFIDGGDEEQDVKILCNGIKQSNPMQTVIMLVTHFTIGCRSGFVCMTFYKRDGHVMEMQTGGIVSRPEEACSPPHYQTHSVPFLTLVTSSPEPQQCPYLGKFSVTGIGHNQRNVRENQRNFGGGTFRDLERVRHGDDRHGRKFDFNIDKRRANNEYLLHEQSGRKIRSDRSNWYHTEFKSNKNKLKNIRKRRGIKTLEDFQIGLDAFKQNGKIYPREFDDMNLSSQLLQVQEDHFGDYESDEKPNKRSLNLDDVYLSYHDLLRIKRNLEYEMEDDELNDDNERREKREEDETRCSPEVTTLNVGCSTADRMEFQSDCVDDSESITAYSCHGRWFDAEGTQFVIATPLARRSGWSNGNNGPQPFRNSRRLCFMYRESGGVVSLTASPVACQRSIPPPAPMLAFNATSIGQCMEDNSSTHHRASYLMIIITIVITIYLEIVR